MIPLAVSNPATANDLCFHDTTNAAAASAIVLMTTTAASPPAGYVAWPPNTLFSIIPCIGDCICDVDVGPGCICDADNTRPPIPRISDINRLWAGSA
jgi:hypothetical protein